MAATQVVDPVRAARELAAHIAAAAEDIERNRGLPDALVAALFEAGLFSLLVPRSMGGLEIDLLTFARAIEEVARVDASAAWCLGQANGLTAYVAHGDPAAMREVFGEPGTILANGPGEGNRPGKAIRVEGGWRISGRWMFASGIGHATWLLAICHLYDERGEPILDRRGESAWRLMLVPKSAVTVHDVWHVVGLRGTGSQSFSASEVFVPQARAIDPEAPVQERGVLYLFSNNGVFGPAFGSVALGIASAALAEFVDFAGAKVPRTMQHPIRDNATVQAGVAQARARLESARAYLHQTLSWVWASAAARGSLEVSERVEARLAATHATQEAAAVMDAVYAMAGSHAILETGPFARRFRDMHAVTQQYQARRQHYEHVGRYLLGLDPEIVFL